ncbi:Regulatory protein TenI [Bacillus sp. THAF10]|uniref:thiazole tautomerase TenI n=1 Tax=Bacillus sp. THAF10 TaxID=2587848 RepID=UPI00126873AF|nr:thiazole tautomerase TenI [Bacillus sp. THAF10]QFT88218.1 Regulatory protein TenI [Bacillus sp. THAF10]
MQLHVITDGKRTIEELTEKLFLIHEQVNFIHIREKHRPARELIQLVSNLIDAGVPPKKILLNDRVDVAVVMELGGVQLAYHSLPVSEVRRCFPQLKVGSSVHSLEEAVRAERDGADFVVYGHVYETASKLGKKPKALHELREISKLLHIPVIAIGGITPKRTPEVLLAGAEGIAVMSGIWDEADCVRAVQDYHLNGKEEMA